MLHLLVSIIRKQLVFIHKRNLFNYLLLNELLEGPDQLTWLPQCYSMSGKTNDVRYESTDLIG